MMNVKVYQKKETNDANLPVGGTCQSIPNMCSCYEIWDVVKHLNNMSLARSVMYMYNKGKIWIRFS